MAEPLWSNAPGLCTERIAYGYRLCVQASVDGRSVFWRVDATSAVSEWPEVYDCGFERTVAAGKAACVAALARALDDRS